MTINTHAKDSPTDVHEFILQELVFMERRLSEAIDRQRLLFGVVAPRFSGGDPTEWICGIERYYDLSLTTESDRLELVPLLLDSPASEWLCFFQKNNPEASWQEFLLAIRRHFGPDCYEDDVDQEDALKLAPQFAASHAESHTKGPLTPKDGTVAGVPISSAQVNVVVPPSATLLATSSSLEVQPEPPPTVYDNKGMQLPNSKTTAMPDRKTTALPDSPTTAQHRHSLLTYCEDAEWSRASRQLLAETEVRIFDPGAFDGVEFIHADPDKVSDDVLDEATPKDVKSVGKDLFCLSQASDGRAIPPRMNVTCLRFSADELIFDGSTLDYSFMLKEAVWCRATSQFGDEIGVRIFDPGPLEDFIAALSIGIHNEGEHRAATTGVVVEAKIWYHFRNAYFFFPP